jgi:hypothetical protein
LQFIRVIRVLQFGPGAPGPYAFCLAQAFHIISVLSLSSAAIAQLPSTPVSRPVGTARESGAGWPRLRQDGGGHRAEYGSDRPLGPALTGGGLALHTHASLFGVRFPSPGAPMRAYLATTGILFAVLVAAHLWRMALEPSLTRDPWYLILSVVAAGLSIWAFSLLRRVPRPAHDGRS